MHFRDRSEAGQILAEELARRPETTRPELVLALPRGGLPIGAEISFRLGIPLDVLVVRKIGMPGQNEYALGAIAAGGVRVINPEAQRALGIEAGEIIDRLAGSEARELNRRERLYRGERAPISLGKKRIVLVDDGLATGSTMRAAARAVRARQPVHLLIAVPVAAPSSFEEMRAEANEVLALSSPEDFFGVGQFYENFRQVSDEEVCAFLDRAAHPRDAF